ncbi:sensor histidine kinase [Herbiconiux sp. SYSU D00978]|uniref:sensor histidine kinase n=1 Tax=Herbiconiux sp. SYSU D00978 TaxID=2812562 RepID=UPI0027DDFA9D|nr:sensor histidine kinase [Herbiconiux sp. SYSU D00978]
MTTTLPDPLGEDWQRPRPDRRGYRQDAILAAVLFAGALVSYGLYWRAGFYEEPAPLGLSLLVIALHNLPIALRRRAPELVLIVVSVLFVAGQLLYVPELLFANITLFIAIYTVGAWGRNRRVAMLVRAAVILGMFVYLLIALFTTGSNGGIEGLSMVGTLSPFVAFGLIQILTNLLYFGGGYYFGDHAWRAARERATLEVRSAELAAERERTAAQAVTRERLRIARELHDVVAHHVSVMGVQAGAARRVLARDPEQAVRSLEAIESSAREAVSELRGLLGTLRDEGAEGTEGTETDATDAASTHGVEQLPQLIDEARRAGLTASVTVVGQERPLTPTVALALYRVAQEAVTNTVKHAGASASLDMRLRYLDGAVELEVTDSGGSPIAGAKGAGLGHVGMRERIAAVGGTLELGPRPRGGYLVRAHIPTVTAATPQPVTVATGAGA